MLFIRNQRKEHSTTQKRNLKLSRALDETED